MTTEIKKAFSHVKSIFPTLSIVIFSKDGRWCYMDEDFKAFNFTGTDIDVSTLEEASNSVDELPYIYQPNQLKVNGDGGDYWLEDESGDQVVSDFWSRQDAEEFAEEQGWNVVDSFNV